MKDQDLDEHVRYTIEGLALADSAIRVSVRDGIVTLCGHVATHTDKLAVEEAIEQLHGVRAIANPLTVASGNLVERTDTDLAEAAADALEWSTLIPSERITASVSNGWITLRGMVDWDYERDAAEHVIHGLAGVKGLVDQITVASRPQAVEIQERIHAAFRHSADIDAQHIDVAAADGTVILSGHVRSWTERADAERAALTVPGVRTIDDRLTVIP